MSYTRYHISSTPPPMMSSDGYLSSYNPYLTFDPKIQFAGQGTTPVASAPQVVQQPVMQQPVMQQPVMQQPVIQQPVMQQPVMQQPVMMTQPTVMAQPMMIQAQPVVTKESHLEPKGWTIVNIILILILISCCIMSISNILDGEILNGVLAIVCLCIFYCIYSWYNGQEETPHK